MLVVTTENVPGHRVRKAKARSSGWSYAGAVWAATSWPGCGRFAGGEFTEYTQLLEEARRHAVDRMVANATTMGANALVMMRFDSSESRQTMSEIVAYGTAVVLNRPDLESASVPFADLRSGAGYWHGAG